MVTAAPAKVGLEEQTARVRFSWRLNKLKDTLNFRCFILVMILVSSFSSSLFKFKQASLVLDWK